MVGKGRHNYHEESEASINKQINIELNAHYQYLALVSVAQTSIEFSHIGVNKEAIFIYISCYRLPSMIVMTWL